MILLYGGVQADEAQREHPRLPPEAEAGLARRLDALLRERRPSIAVGALASGSDILIAEAALRCGIDLRVVLPFSVEVFRAKSVEPHGVRWLASYDAILEDPGVSVVEGNGAPDGVEVYRAHNRTLADAAASLAVRTGGTVELLAIRPSARDASVTDHLVALAAERGYRIVELDPEG